MLTFRAQLGEAGPLGEKSWAEFSPHSSGTRNEQLRQLQSAGWLLAPELLAELAISCP